MAGEAKKFVVYFNLPYLVKDTRQGRRDHNGKLIEGGSREVLVNVNRLETRCKVVLSQRNQKEEGPEVLVTN